MHFITLIYIVMYQDIMVNPSNVSVVVPSLADFEDVDMYYDDTRRDKGGVRMSEDASALLVSPISRRSSRVAGASILPGEEDFDMSAGRYSQPSMLEEALDEGRVVREKGRGRALQVLEEPAHVEEEPKRRARPKKRTIKVHAVMLIFQGNFLIACLHVCIVI
jgi:hypothetical protein